MGGFYWNLNNNGQNANPLSPPFYAVSNDKPDEMSEQDRLAAYGWTHGMDQGLRDDQNQQQQLSTGFLDQLMTGPGGYGNIFAGGAGYTPGQQEDILQEGLQLGGIASEEELANLGYSPDEIASIMGDPYAARDISAGGLDWLDSLQQEANKRQREAFGDQGYWEGQLKSAIDPNALRVANDYYDRNKDIITAARDAYGDAIDPSRLGLSQNFNQNFNFGPGDMQDIVNQAGRDVMLSGQARNEALARAAAAQGNTGALALNAARDRNALRSNIAAEEAMTDARIRAKQLGLNTTSQAEQMRLGTEQDIADRYDRAIQYLTNQKMGASQDYEQQRRGAEQDISTRLMNAANSTGQARLNTERGIGEAQQQIGQYGTNLIADLTQQGERDASARASGLASGRQAAAGTAMNTRFNQYNTAAGNLGQRFAGIYGQQKAEEQEGRGFLSGQQQQATDQASVARQQRINTGLGGMQAAQSGARNVIEAKKIPTLFDKILSAGAGAAAGYFGGK